jgi:hypothetical protein
MLVTDAAAYSSAETSMKQHGMQFFHTSRLLLLESRFYRFSYNESWKMLHVRLVFEACIGYFMGQFVGRAES